MASSSCMAPKTVMTNDKTRDGIGWTTAISEDSGEVVLTASGDEVAFVIFAAALPLSRID